VEYVMGSDPERVHAAREAVEAERKAGKSPFTRKVLSGAEQRRLGMPPPGERLKQQQSVTTSSPSWDVADEEFFTDDEMGEAAWLAEYEPRTENHQSQEALDAEHAAQHEVFMKADAQMNAIP